MSVKQEFGYYLSYQPGKHEKGDPGGAYIMRPANNTPTMLPPPVHVKITRSKLVTDVVQVRPAKGRPY